MASSNKNQNYLHGAVILTAAVVITKIFGAIYKIPLGNILGTEGIAYFNVAYNLYNVFLTLSTAGLPIALAKMVSEANSLNRPNQIKRIFSVAMTAFIVLGLICSAIMFIFPTELADYMGNIHASQSVMMLAPAIILVCVMSAFRGYTQGLSDMKPTSISQVIEVAGKVAFGLAAAMLLGSAGYSVTVMSAGAISGVAVGSLLACVYMGFVAKNRAKSERLRWKNAGVLEIDVADSSPVVLKKLLKIGIPIALGSCILSVITLVNTKLIYDRLQEGAKLSFDTANNLFGEYSLTLPLFNLPAAIITPLTISVVPAIAAYIAKRQYTDARLVTQSSLRIATIIALPMAVGLSVLSMPVLQILYPDEVTALGGRMLTILGAGSFFVCLALMTTAILQASGREKLPMITMLIGGALNIFINWNLLGMTDINIYGAPIGTLSCYVVMSVLNLIFVMKKLPEKPKLARVFVMPVINCAIMGAVAWILYPAVLKILGAGPSPERMTIMIALVATIGVAVLLYLFLTIFTQAITLEDMKLLPKGEKIAKILHIK